MRGHSGFKVVAGAYSDKPACFAGEQVGYRARIFSEQGNAGQNERTGVDLVTGQVSGVVLAIDEVAQRRAVDGRGARIGREQNVGLVQHLARHRDVPPVLPLELQARKQQVRGGRPDVYADAGEDNSVLLSHVPRWGGETHSLIGDRGGLRFFEGRRRHGEVDAFGGQAAAVLLANERVFLVVQDGPSTFVDAEQIAGFDV